MNARSPRPTTAAALALALALALAGCLKAPASEEGEDPLAGAAVVPPEAQFAKPGFIRGLVMTPALAPLTGANVTLISTNETRATDARGLFAFRDIPEGRHLLHASKPGFVAKTVAAVVERGMVFELNITLLPVPPVEPRQETVELRGLIACGYVLQTPGDGGHAARRQPTNCGAADPNSKQVWEIDIERDARGIVIEQVWEPNTPASSHLDLLAETVDYGDSNKELGYAHSPGGYGRLEVPGEVLRQYYPAGGTIRVKTGIGPSVLDDESALNIGVAVQEEVTIYFTVFYHAGPPQAFTVLKK